MKNDIFFCHRFFQNPITIPFRAHAHDLWEFLFITQGNVSCMIEGKRYPIKNGSLIIIRPAQIHRMQLGGDCPYEYYSLMCDVPSRFQSMVAQISDDVRILNFAENPTVSSIYSELKRQFEGSSKVSHQESTILLIEELLKTVAEASTLRIQPGPLSEDPLIDRAISYIEANLYLASPISLAEIYGFSPSA